MNITDLIAAMRDRWRMATIIAIALFVIIVAWIALQPRLYQASSSLLFNISETDPTVSQEERPSDSSRNLLGTQADVITSSFLSKAVAERMARADGRKLGDDALTAQAQALAAQVTVVPGKASNVLEITVQDRSPEQAARIANAFAETYLDKQRDLREISAKGYATWLDERTADVRHRLEDAQRKLTAAQRQSGQIGVERLDLEGERLRSLNTELSESEGSAAEARSRAGAGNVSQVQFSGAVQGLEASVASQNAKVAELARTLGPNHPTLMAAQAELATLRGELAQARGRAAGALAADSASAQRREAELRSKLGAQRGRIIGLSANQEQLTVLQQDVDIARKTYESVRRRFGDVAIRSVISQTNVAQLDHAVPPMFAAKPNVPLLTLVGLLLSLGVAVSTVFLFELLEPRVRTVDGVEYATQRPVIANFSRTPLTRLRRFFARPA